MMAADRLLCRLSNRPLMTPSTASSAAFALTAPSSPPTSALTSFLDFLAAPLTTASALSFCPSSVEQARMATISGTVEVSSRRWKKVAALAFSAPSLVYWRVPNHHLP